MTIGALNLDGGADLTLEFCIAVTVLHEMAIDAVHAFLQMDVHVMNWHVVLWHTLLGRQLLIAHRRHEVSRCRIRNDLAAMVEQISLAVLAEDGAECPAVA